MKTKLDGIEAWDFAKALKHYRVDIREKGKNIQPKCIHFNKTIKLRGEFSAASFMIKAISTFH